METPAHHRSIYRSRPLDTHKHSAVCSTDENAPPARPTARAAAAEPARADTELLNADSLAGSLALASRGGCSFAEKARRLQAAGALGVVFVNSESDAELHPAADITEHHGGASTMDITIPVVCVGLGVATRAGLVDALTTGRSWGRAGLELVSEWVAVPDCPAESASLTATPLCPVISRRTLPASRRPGCAAAREAVVACLRLRTALFPNAFCQHPVALVGVGVQRRGEFCP